MPVTRTKKIDAKKFPCPFITVDPITGGIVTCTRTVSRKADLPRHLKTHDAETKYAYPCDQEGCNYSDRQESNTKSHKVTVHGMTWLRPNPPKRRAPRPRSTRKSKPESCDTSIASSSSCPSSSATSHISTSSETFATDYQQPMDSTTYYPALHEDSTTNYYDPANMNMNYVSTTMDSQMLEQSYFPSSDTSYTAPAAYSNALTTTTAPYNTTEWNPSFTNGVENTIYPEAYTTTTTKSDMATQLYSECDSNLLHTLNTDFGYLSGDYSAQPAFSAEVDYSANGLYNNTDNVSSNLDGYVDPYLSGAYLDQWLAESSLGVMLPATV